MPASPQPARPSAATRSRWPQTSSPPSVVTSSRRSGTSVAWSGFTSQAISEISGVAGHFQVQLDRHRLAQDAQVAVRDVAAVFAQMERDAVGPAQFGQGRGPDRVRLISPPRLPDRGHVIDVYAQLRHGADYSEPRGQEPGVGKADSRTQQCRNPSSESVYYLAPDPRSRVPHPTASATVAGDWRPRSRCRTPSKPECGPPVSPGTRAAASRIAL